MEAYKKWKDDKDRIHNDSYGTEVGSEEENQEEQEPPILPEFDREEAEMKFDDENPDIEVPEDSEPDVNNDWVLDEDQEAE